MHVNAFIRRDSFVHRNWKYLGWLKGTLNGVEFTLHGPLQHQGSTYVAEDITPEQLPLVRGQVSVQIEMEASPGELPDDLKDAVKIAEMAPEHERLNELMDHAVEGPDDAPELTEDDGVAELEQAMDAALTDSPISRKRGRPRKAR